MSLKISEVANILVQGNKTAFKANASRRAGQMFNDRVVSLIAPKLPMMVRGYSSEPWFKFLLANAVAGTVIKYGAQNDKLAMLADAGINAASDDFLGSFNIEEMINQLVDGIDISGLTAATSASTANTTVVMDEVGGV
ncbi:MAG: hypothetical protein DRP57_04310 [Spirochaetes bacterium]|nr:MAG: hypothetical protein DRP57_04310 [Spirochaetota bacterium]